MALLRPHYIHPIAAGSRLSWPWDDWNVKQAYEPGDAALAARLQPLTRRAQLAMGVAIGEWIVFTLEALGPDPRPKQYLEAAWLGTVHFACCPYVEFVDREWSGPVRGPLHLTMALINDALHFEGASPSENAAWLSTLAQLVVPPDAPYIAWRDAVLNRLERWFPASPEADDDFAYDWQSVEPLVPRECFDPTAPFDPSMSEDLIRRALTDIGAAPHLYASTPEQRERAGVVLPLPNAR
ncbi:L-serine deaminase [Labilithrix luteola]|uniref:L-serine deaminase n=1 Tax=Labilithrix luteola TaxID=1391654 RepID=A0A0K1Q1V6_9BACT|nr:hypothetical protein [Labilithrix luteola]AKU99717.1 L-serine deaminase [Labilithrix luteola]